MVLPTLATKIGLNEAMFLQQLHDWVERSKHVMEGRRWIYNTVDDWCKQFPFWSRRTLTRIIANLEKRMLIVAANYNRKGFDHTKWYTVNYEHLAELETASTRASVKPDVKEVEKHRTDRSGSATSADPHDGQETIPLYPQSPTRAIDGTSMVPIWHNEENQAPMASKIDGTSIVPDWHNEELQGLEKFPASVTDVAGTMMVSDCPIPLCQNGTMDNVNLAQPIPENNNREYLQRTTTTTHTAQPLMNRCPTPTREDLLLFPFEDRLSRTETIFASTSDEPAAYRYLREFGAELSLILKKFDLLRRLTQHPAENFRDIAKKPDMRTQVICKETRQKQKTFGEMKHYSGKGGVYHATEKHVKDGHVVDPSSPFYKFLHRHHKNTPGSTDKTTGFPTEKVLS